MLRGANMQNVEGKVAFITGGASGIGLGIAKTFVNAGMKVVISDIREDRMGEAMAGFDQMGRGKAFIASNWMLRIARRSPGLRMRRSGYSAKFMFSATTQA